MARARPAPPIPRHGRPSAPLADADIEHQQRHSDGDHRVAEQDQPLVRILCASAIAASSSPAPAKTKTAAHSRAAVAFSLGNRTLPVREAEQLFAERRRAWRSWRSSSPTRADRPGRRRAWGVELAPQADAFGALGEIVLVGRDTSKCTAPCAPGCPSGSGRTPWASSVLKIIRSPGSISILVMVSPVVSGCIGSRSAGWVFTHSSKL